MLSRIATLKKILAEHGYHLFFASSLVALLALAAWWSVFMIHAIDERHESALMKLRYEARMIAAILGHSPLQPRLGHLEKNTDLEIVKNEGGDKLEFVLSPSWPQYSIGIAKEKAEEVQRKYTRQKVMWIGEGSTLFILILISMFMLYRLVGMEQRYRGQMDRFLDLVTHELKTPLAGVRSLLQTIAMGRVSCEEMPHLTALGMKNIERLDHLVQNILVRNRLSRKRYVTQIEPVNLREFAAAVIEGRVGTDKPGAAPVVEDGQDVFAMADRESLRVILDNLLDNAEKYGKSERPVAVATGDVEGYAKLTVRDFGMGIAPENLDRVFNPFFRVQSKADNAPRGSGLGLSICRDLVGRMGGRIRATSEGLGRGATFEVVLPRAVR